MTHPDEIPIDEAMVGRLLAEQFPAWAALPLRRNERGGSDHAIFRLGEDMLVRLARRPSATAQVDKEAEWLPRLAPGLPAPVPTPLAVGEPGCGYPHRWSVGRWLEGKPLSADPPHDSVALARDLGDFVRALQSADATGAPRPGAHNAWRGCRLARRDPVTRAALAEVQDMVDVEAAAAAWGRALAAPAWEGPPVWIHGDLLPGNLLVRDRRLGAVIDFGLLGAGDPACDLQPAWFLFDGQARRAFREPVALDTAAWERGRGWGLSAGLMMLSYYRHRDPPIAAVGARAVAAVLADPD